VHVQRKLYEKYQNDRKDIGSKDDNDNNHLTNKQIQALNSIHFVWDGIQTAKWWNNYHQLVSYYNNNEHPNNESKEDFSLHKTNPNLAQWFVRQRRYYRQYVHNNNANISSTATNTAKNYMTEEKKKALDNLEFLFRNDFDKTITSINSNKNHPLLPMLSSAESKNASWHQTFQELISFKKKYNHTNVPQSFPSNPKLGHWVSEQRKQYLYYLQQQEQQQKHEKLKENGNEKEGNIKRKIPSSTFCKFPERLVKLKKIGFTWAVRKRRRQPIQPAQDKHIEGGREENLS